MICVLCNEEIKGDVVNGEAKVYGHNPAPLSNEGRCCDDCNYGKVLLERLKMSWVKPIKCVEKKQK
tara:strand:+ start:522 stop:719 length:198 start_codon:yes stop_codon:yes gene_type:complete